MRSTINTVFIGVFLLLLLPSSASASAVWRSGETVSITNDQIVSGDFYAGAGVVSNSGRVEGDLYSAAGSFTNNGEILGDLAVAGGSIQIHSDVADDVRVAGGEVVIAGHVGGDVVVFGGLLKILSTATIDGDVLFFGGDLQVLGPVEGSVMGTSENTRIDSKVGQSVDVKTTNFSLGDRAEVLGDVRYVSNSEVNRSQNAVIVGEVVRNTAQVDMKVSYDGLLLSFIIILFSALVLQLLFRNQLVAVLPQLTDKMGMAGLIGIAVMVLTPVIIAVSIASMLGIMVGLILVAAFLLLLLFSFSFSSILVGSLVHKYTKGTVTPNVLYTVIGAVIIQVLFLVPVIGPTIVFVIFFIAIGGLVRALFNLLHT